MDSEVLFIKKFRCCLPCVKLSVLAKLFSIFQESLEKNIVINKGLLFFLSAVTERPMKGI